MDVKSSLVAAIFASFVLTLFSYAFFVYYLQLKQPEELFSLRKYFIGACRKELSKHLANKDTQLLLAQATERLILQLEQQKPAFDQHRFVRSVNLFFNRTYMKKLQEILLFSSIDEQLGLIEKDPLNPRVHSSLAKTYLSLFQLYQEEPPLGWLRSKKEKNEREQRKEAALHLAIEEFRIALSSLPADPWLLTQLARCYQMQENKSEELYCYEQLLLLFPSDPELLLQLGNLYFEKGSIVNGLKMFQQLSLLAHPHSHELMKQYSSFLRKI